MTDLLNSFSFADGEILEVVIRDGEVEVLFKQWTEQTLKIEFDYVWKLIDTNCTGHEIEDLVIFSESDHIKSVASFLEDEGMSDDISKLQQYSFISSTTGEAVLEIISSSISIVVV